MYRLNHVLAHIGVDAIADSPELRAIKQRLTLESLRAQFELPPARLREMAYFMLHEMHKGLVDESSSTIRMLPSYVFKASAGDATGVVYALDLGGTNFRVLRMSLRAGALEGVMQQQFAIPAEHMSGTADGLFGFVAASVKRFVDSNGLAATDNAAGGTPIALGFTFSFPVKQTAINAGSLIQWTKGFSTSGVAGHDVVGLLQTQLDRLGLRMRTTALCNDTVGTLVAKYFADPTTQVGVILGTGANACYWEAASAVTKAADVARRGPGASVVINMEFGNFDSTDLLVLPRTPFDDIVDKGSPNAGFQRFEKMISGLYLGELARLILVRLSQNGTLPAAVAQKLGAEREARFALGERFSGENFSAILADGLPGLHGVSRVLLESFGLDLTHVSDRKVVRTVCWLVCCRAAQLAGMATAAILLKAGKQHNATVAIDGSVFEKTPGFKRMMERAVRQVLGSGCDVRLVLQREGSGLGAGFIAALASRETTK